MKKLITALLLAALIPATSFASFMGGNELLARCTTEGTEIEDSFEDYKALPIQSKERRLVGFFNRSNCNGYIKAISDAHSAFVFWGYMEPTFCTPKGSSAGQFIKIVVKYLNENPEILRLEAGGAVVNAISDAFPVSYKDDGTRYCPE